MNSHGGVAVGMLTRSRGGTHALIGLGQPRLQGMIDSDWQVAYA